MQEISDIKHLLQHISIIHKKYDDIAEATGENFNVFQLLNVNHYENTHSSIISFFLNSKANHGQKDLYLKLFIEVLNEKFLNAIDKNPILFKETNYHLLNLFQTIESQSITEYVAGKIDNNYENGGRIDVLLKDKFNKKIIIENKIYAVDQAKQLVRYNNFDKNAPIFYLNLYNDAPSDNSKGELTENKEFFVISYEIEIVKWLDKCIKESANKPFLRETLNQYLNLIKELTNQSTNKVMEKEITEILIKNFNSFVQIVENRNNVFEEIIKNLQMQLSQLAKKLEIERIDLPLNSELYTGFYFKNEYLNEHNLNLSFEFEQNNYSNMKFGFFIDNENPTLFNLDKLKKLFADKFKQIKSDGDWIAFLPFDEYRNWCSNSYDTFNDILNGKFIETIEEKVKKMLEIVNELQNKN